MSVQQDNVYSCGRDGILGYCNLESTNTTINKRSIRIGTGVFKIKIADRYVRTNPVTFILCLTRALYVGACGSARQLQSTLVGNSTCLVVLARRLHKGI